MGSCVGSCLGGCTARLCEDLLSIRIGSAWGTLVQLLCLQLLVTFLACIVHWPLQELCRVVAGGVCACTSESCWVEQLRLRVLASGFACFVALALLSRCCVSAAAHGCALGKALATVLLAVALCFMDNSYFNVFASAATLLEPLFVLAQTVLFVDIAYNASSSLTSIQSCRGNEQVVFLGISAALLMSSLCACWILWQDAQSGQELILLTLVLGISLGIASVSETLQERGSPGNLLSSCLMLAYGVYLTWQALLVPVSEAPGGLPWSQCVALSVELLALSALLTPQYSNIAGKAEVTVELLPEDGEGLVGVAEGVSRSTFGLHTVIHALAVLFATAHIVPSSLSAAFWCRCCGLFGAFLVYAWTLIAPAVLSGRDFST